MVYVSRTPERGACVCATVEDVTNQTVKAVPVGTVGTLEYRLHFQNSLGKAISPWHSIPLYAGDGIFNFVCEIPRNTRAKFEVATCEQDNPIKQDSKKGKPRSYAIDIPWNYGMLPQTWEDPAHISEDCEGHIGDNDPVDIVEIGDRTSSTGSIYAVKPIAALAMIDEGELDWKVVAISTSDPRYELVNDVGDLEVHFPGTLSAVREWFRTYKTFDGKPLNKFVLNERAMDREYTLNTIAQTHAFWKSMVLKSRQGKQVDGGVVVGDVPVPSACFDPDEVAEVTRDAKEVLRKEEVKEGEVYESDEKGLAAVEDVLEQASTPRRENTESPSLTSKQNESSSDRKRVEISVS